MSHSKSSNRNRTSLWVAIGAIFLIILLVLWLTVAFMGGDTDVAAFIAPYVVNGPAMV